MQEVRPTGVPPPAVLPAVLLWPAVTVLAAVAFGIMVGTSAEVLLAGDATAA